jgi:positive regulator of sigma E activity
MQPYHQGETLLEEGVVLAVTPPVGDRPAQARVRLLAGDHCEGCPAGAFCRPTGDERRLMDVLDPVGVKVGDHVQVAVPGGAILKASFLIYGLPLLLLLVGVGLGTLIWPAGEHLRDLWSFLLGAALAGAAVPWVRRLVERAESAGGRLLPARIEARLSAGEAGKLS